MLYEWRSQSLLRYMTNYKMRREDRDNQGRMSDIHTKRISTWAKQIYMYKYWVGVISTVNCFQHTCNWFIIKWRDMDDPDAWLFTFLSMKYSLTRPVHCVVENWYETQRFAAIILHQNPIQIQISKPLYNSKKIL